MLNNNTPPGENHAPAVRPEVASILTLVGLAVLLAIPKGRKAPRATAWQKLTLSDMARPEYLATFREDDNIGVSLGEASGGLTTIDLDQREAMDEFLALNPRLATSLRTTRIRGGNIWMRIEGGFPPSAKLRAIDPVTGAKAPVGEWRADGNQTVIQGEAIQWDKGETVPTPYRRVVDAPPVVLRFEQIVWPEGWVLPWRPASSGTTTRGGPAAIATGDRMIILPSGTVSILQCGEGLFPLLAEGGRTYTRGGVVVELGAEGGLEIVSAPALRSRMEAVGRVVAWRSGDDGEPVLKPARCPEDMTRALLVSLPARELLPPIASVLSCPVAIEDGHGNLRVLCRGYHPERGGLLITGGEEPPRVDVAEAVAALGGLLDDFEFVTESDRSRALAAFLAPAMVIGGMLDGRVPVDVAEADRSQAGKGFRQKLIAAIYRSEPQSVTQRERGVGGLEESFSGALITGRPFIQLDNLRGALDSPFLEAFLTADSICARIPYRPEIRVDPLRYFVMATSNGVETTIDLANRSSIIRIRHRGANYQFKEFPEGDVLRHVQARQPFYLGCVYSVLADWLATGKKRTREGSHAYRAWAQSMDWIVQGIFAAPKLLDGHRAAQERVASPGMNFLRACALAADQAGRLAETYSATLLVDLAESAGVVVPNLRPGSDERAAAKQVGIVLGRIYRDANAEEIEVDGYLVRRTERREDRQDGNGDRVCKAYQFRRVNPSTTPTPQAPQPV